MQIVWQKCVSPGLAGLRIFAFLRKVNGMNTGNQFLGTERIGTLMRKYAVPCIISLLVGALYNIVDQIFIANASYLGSYGNAANTVVFPLTVVALAIAVMVGDGCCAFVSMALGRNEVDKAKRSVGNAVVLIVAGSLVLTAVYLIFADGIIAMFGGTVNEETFHHSQEYFFYITLGIPFGHVFPLIVKLFAFAQTNLNLDIGALKIKRKRDQRIPLLFHKTKKAQDLAFMHQQAPHTHRILVEDISFLIRADMHLLDQQFTVFNITPGILQVRTVLPKGFHLSSSQFNPCLIGLFHKIGMTYLTVFTNGFERFFLCHTSHPPFDADITGCQTGNETPRNCLSEN